MKHPKGYPLVYIEWQDHVSNDEWFPSPSHVAEATLATDVITIGWLVHEDSKSYIVVNNIAVDGTMTMAMRILKGTVNTFKEIECPKS